MSLDVHVWRVRVAKGVFVANGPTMAHPVEKTVLVPLDEEQIRMLLDRLAPAEGGYSGTPLTARTQVVLSMALGVAARAGEGYPRG